MANLPRGKAPKRRPNARRPSRPARTMRAAPIAVSMRAPVAAPRTTSRGSGRNGSRTTVVRNEEPMAFISSAATANLEVIGALPLSAASASLPWLAQIGSNYSRYRFRSLQCWYEPVCSSTTPGQITLVMVFDENDIDAVTSTNILQTEGNRKASVWDKTDLVRYDPQRAQLRWYVIKSNPANTTLANISVPAWLLFAAFSSQVSTDLGRLMCRYEVEFDSAIAPAMQG